VFVVCNNTSRGSNKTVVVVIVVLLLPRGGMVQEIVVAIVMLVGFLLWLPCSTQRWWLVCIFVCDSEVMPGATGTINQYNSNNNNNN
jgi:hypothetical protein